MKNRSSLKWLAVAILAILAWDLTSWLPTHRNNSIDVYSFAQHARNESIPLHKIDRGFSFPMLFIDHATAPFSFDLPLGTSCIRGKRSCWVFAEQASNHGQLDFSSNKITIGTIDNKREDSFAGMAEKLSYVGDLKVTHHPVTLHVIGTNSTKSASDPFYDEMGLIVLAPQGMTEETILNFLHGKMKHTWGLDFGGLFIFLLLSFGVLCFVARTNAFSPTSAAPIITTWILAIYVSFSIGAHFDIPYLKTDSASFRMGIEKKINDKWTKLIAKAKKRAIQSFPDREVDDSVPDRFKKSEGTFQTTIYYNNRPAGLSNLYQNLLGGTLSKVQKTTQKSFKKKAHLFFILIAMGILWSFFSNRAAPILFTLGLISLCSLYFSLRISWGWDELFINLRHSFMLLHHGVYSVNAHTRVEGTVDFVPLILIAMLGCFRVPLYDGALLVSLFGNILIIGAIYLVARKSSGNRTWALLAALMAGLYPNVLWMGASGFFSTFFTGWLLWGAYFLLFTERRVWALALLASLTLVRTEGILFAALLTGYKYVIEPIPTIFKTRQWKEPLWQAIRDGAIVTAPFLISLLVRKIVFGSPLPTPIVFKNPHFDGSFFACGLDRFGTMVSSHDLHLIFLWVVLLFGTLACMGRLKKLRALLVLDIALFLFIIPYYSGGGDWLPELWNRYSIALNLLLVTTLMVLLYETFLALVPQWGTASLYVFSLCVAWGYSESIHFSPTNAMRQTATQVAGPNNDWSRINTLSDLGQFLHKTLPPDATVASPEEATIMYFSEHEMIGLLGVSTPEIARMPFQPLFKGNILHRRRAYLVVTQKRPDILALYEPALQGNYADGADLDQRIHTALTKEIFDPYKIDVLYYRVGSIAALQKMGYRHLTICYTDHLFSLFVSERIYDRFIVSLQEKGFDKWGVQNIDYKVSAGLTEKYLPGAPEILKDL